MALLDSSMLLPTAPRPIRSRTSSLPLHFALRFFPRHHIAPRQTTSIQYRYDVQRTCEEPALITSSITDLQQPCVSTYADVTGHAHPSLMGAKVANTEDEGLSHLHNLVSGMPLHIVPRGFADEGLTPTSALVYPQVRRSPLGNEVVQHLDIVSCWKGLSQSQTLELTIWARLFRESLASHIKYHLQHDLTEQLSGYPGECQNFSGVLSSLQCDHSLTS